MNKLLSPAPVRAPSYSLKTCACTSGIHKILSGLHLPSEAAWCNTPYPDCHTSGMLHPSATFSKRTCVDISCKVPADLPYYFLYEAFSSPGRGTKRPTKCILVVPVERFNDNKCSTQSSADWKILPVKAPSAISTLTGGLPAMDISQSTCANWHADRACPWVVGVGGVRIAIRTHRCTLSLLFGVFRALHQRFQVVSTAVVLQQKEACLQHRRLCPCVEVGGAGIRCQLHAWWWCSMLLCSALHCCLRVPCTAW